MRKKRKKKGKKKDSFIINRKKKKWRGGGSEGRGQFMGPNEKNSVSNIAPSTFYIKLMVRKFV